MKINEQLILDWYAKTHDFERDKLSFGMIMNVIEYPGQKNPK